MVTRVAQVLDKPDTCASATVPVRLEAQPALSVPEHDPLPATPAPIDRHPLGLVTSAAIFKGHRSVFTGCSALDGYAERSNLELACATAAVKGKPHVCGLI
jgi:hypothetical protein